MRPITQSMMQTMMRCEEKGRLRYLEQLVSPEPPSPALSIGSAVHRGFEVQSADAAVALLRQSREPTWLDSEAASLNLDAAKVRAMVTGGLELWPVWPEAAEVQFCIPFVNPWSGRASTRHTLEGVFDGVFDNFPLRSSSGPVLLEIKTTSRLDSSYLERLDLDWQVSTYLAVASVVYQTPVREMVYRIIRKPSIKQRKTETLGEYTNRVIADYKDRPEFYFEEVIVTRTDLQIERWWYEAWEMHKRILRIENGGMTVRTSGHCLDFGRCTYFDLCRGVVGPSAFRVKEAHPELKRRRTDK